MTETNGPTPTDSPTDNAPTGAAPPPFQAPAADATPAVAPTAAPATAGMAAAYGGNPAALGKIRGTGACILLTIVTLGFYTWYWYYKTSEEMKEHSGEGIGGPIALVLAIVVGIVMPFISSNEAGKLYQRRGQQAPVSATTGLWYLLLGWLFLVGCIVWFVKTNAAINDYWRSLGATEG